MQLEQNPKFVELTSKVQKIIYSPLYLAVLVLIGILGFSLRLEVLAIGIYVTIMSFNLVFSRDVTPNFICFLLISMVPLQRYGQVNIYFPLALTFLFIIPAFFFHIFVYKVKFRFGRYFFSLILITIAVTFGGMFSLKIKDYFTMPGIYYVFMLGIGMVAAYLMLENYISRNNFDVVLFFAKTMVAAGCMGILMIIYHYFSHIGASYYQILTDLQWGNNLSNTMLMCMPFCFYLACRDKKIGIVYFILGIMQYIALVMSLSRGGIIFATFTFPFCVLAVFYFNKQDRKKYLFIIGGIIAIFLIFFFIYYRPIVSYLKNLMQISTDDARFGLYMVAWENFKKAPLFGTGLAWKGNKYYFPQPMCIYWYHSTIFQILGSLGILGIIAYGYQYYFRTKVLFSVKSMFNIFAFLAFVGFEGYSIINVGDFAPLPFVLILLEVFVYVDRNNEILRRNNLLLSIEEYPLKKNSLK